MRQALVLTPAGRMGYAGTSYCDAVRRGERAVLVGGASDDECFQKSLRWLARVEVLAVYDDLLLTETMLSVIELARELSVPIEFRQVPPDRVSIVDRAANAA